MKTSLVATNDSASGKLKIRFKRKSSRLELKLRGLEANATYDLIVGEMPWASFVANKKGRAKLRFRSPAKGKTLPLPSDPRGAAVVVRHGSDDVMTGVASGSGESDDSRVDERSTLAPTAAAGGGKAEARFELRDDGDARFKIELEDVATGEYRIFVDGVLRGTLVTNGLGRGELTWDSTPDGGQLLLDFDPRGALVDVLNAADEVVFTGDANAQIPGINVCSFEETEVPLSPSAAAGAGSGRARLRLRDDCRRDFNVEIEDVPIGDYELFVDGVLRGVIRVVDIGGQNEGEIEFDTEPDDADEIFLDFDPAGAAIEVRRGGELFFSTELPANGGPGTGPGPGCSEVEIETEVPLFNTGAIPGASGEARFRLRDGCRADFRVEIEDVPSGSYDLLVGGVLRGTITVVLGEGELEFDDEPEGGELPIDFDPRGLAVEVFDGATLVFERVFPD